MANLNSPLETWTERMTPNESGLHRTIYTHAGYLREDGCSKEETYGTIRRCCDRVADRFVPDREIWSAIDYIDRRNAGEAAPGVQWPKVSMQWRLEILNNYRVDMARLKASIPAPMTRTKDYLDMLYPQTALLCIGKTSYEFRTVRLEDIPEENRDLHTCEFITPSPMSSVAGLTEAGDWSEHARSNTGPRVYAVIEFDFGESHEHAAILKYLAKLLPLVMIVYSGGKSLHGWFKSSHANEHQMQTFYKEAVMLGADPKMFSPTQFSRLPMGRNNRTSRTQRVIFFRPDRVYYHA
jgi:hypothetical protein